MTKKNIDKILDTIEESLAELKALSKVSKKEFMDSREIQDRVKWNFYTLVQGCLDLGNHVISVSRFEMPERYEDIITILGKKNVIPGDLSKSLQGMGGFRNLIAHGYFKIDLDKLYGYLKKIDDVKKYLKNLEPYLEDK